MKLLPLVFRNLLRNKRRSILTILSIAVSIFIFAALISLPTLVAEVMRDRTNSLRLITQSKAGFMSAYPLPEAYRPRIESVRHVEAVAGFSFIVGTYRDPNVQIAAAAVDTDHMDELFPDWGFTQEGEREFKRSRTASLVGEGLMRRYGWKIGDQVIMHGITSPVDVQVTIVGTVGDRAPGAGSALIIRRDYMEELLGRPGTVSFFWVLVDHSQSMPEVTAAIDRMFANSANETSTQTETAVIQTRVASMSLLFNGAKVLAAIVIFTIALVAANTSAMAVRERRHEIGVMRAIGYTRGSIVICIVLEGLLIGVIGGVIGCALARATFVALPYLAASLGPLAYALKMSSRVIANSFGMAILIGSAGALIPAVLATRGDIASELRTV